MIVTERSRIDVAPLLLDIERKAVGGNVMTPQERHDNPVLLEEEKRRLGFKSADLAFRYSVRKLLDAKVFWIPGEKPHEESAGYFTHDTGTGLSALERNIVETQIEAFLRKNDSFDSVLVKSGQMHDWRKEFTKDGVFDETSFRRKIVEVAEITDDSIDQDYLAKRAA
ncbi:MAG: hypothetical protein ABIH11_03945 [Candidatus Altiarchaeota archaeon]